MFLLRLISRIPLSALYVFSDFLFFISYRVVRYRRKMVWKNLQNSFPEKSQEELRKIEKEFYANLCDYAVEMLKLLTISQEELAKRMVYNDVSLIEEFKSKNQPVLILASHQFNWEWLLAAGNFNLPVPVDFVYQPLRNALFDRFSLLSRTRFGSYAIKRDEVARETIRRKNILRGIAIVADQYPGYKNDKRHSTRFLNQDTVFFMGANQLAQLTQYPVVYAYSKKIRRGYYEVLFVKIAEPPYQKDDTSMIESYVEAVERVIRESPSGWLWSHNRWKKRHLRKKAAEKTGS